MTKAVLVREDGTCGPTGLKMIEDMAATHRTQGTIAVALSISKKKFEKMLERNKGENAERLAWESGHARWEQKIADLMEGAAAGEIVDEEIKDEEGNTVIDLETGEAKTEKVRVLSKTATIALIYLTKSQLGWSEKGSGPAFQDNRINITLPDALPRDQLFKMLGITGLADFTKGKPVVELAPKKEGTS